MSDDFPLHTPAAQSEVALQPELAPQLLQNAPQQPRLPALQYLERITHDKGNRDRVVWKARHTDTGNEVAVKAVSIPPHSHLATRDDPRREVRMLRLLHVLQPPSAAIIGYVGHVQTQECFEEQPTMKIVMELGKTDLLNYIEGWNKGEYRSSSEERCRLMLPIFEALDYMHNTLYLAHMDIKPDNVLLLPSPTSSGFVAKLTDFGVTQVLSPTQENLNMINQREVGEEEKNMQEDGPEDGGLSYDAAKAEYLRAQEHFDRNSSVLRTPLDKVGAALESLRAHNHNGLLARDVISPVMPLCGVRGTDNYMAPEVHACREDHNAMYDARAADVFSLGITLFMTAVAVRCRSPADVHFKLRPPYACKKGYDVRMDAAYQMLLAKGIESLVQDGYQYEVANDRFARKALALCARMVKKNPADRISSRVALTELRALLQ